MNIADIKTGTVDRPPRIVLAGVEKIGKSTFAAGAPNPVFVPVKGEEGIDALDVARTPVVETYGELVEVIQALAEQEHKYKTLVIDSVSTLEPIIWDHLCSAEGVSGIEKVGGGYGKGYIEAVGKWREIMAGLDYLRDERGMGCILIGHVAVKTFTDPLGESYDTYELDIHKKASGALMRWSDCILFANSKAIVKKDEKTEKRRAIQKSERSLFTQRRPGHMGGGRGVYGHLPYEMDLSWDAFVSAINKEKEVK